MAATEHRERELKFEVPDGVWAVPELASLVPPGGSLTRDAVVLDSTYYDTADLGLLRARLALRRRTGDDDQGWQLKVPAGDARTEIRLPAEGRGVPAQLRQLTLGVRAGDTLRPTVRILTARERHVIRGVDESALAELAVDAVTATRMGAAAEVTSWREVEVELVDGDETLLKRAAKVLRRSGASPSSWDSKLVRALGHRVTDNPSIGAQLGDLVHAYLDAQRDAIVAGDLALRRDEDVIHATRVATRRYRSVLKGFADLFDAERAAALDAELKWYAALLGDVRDLQVLGKHLHTALAKLPDELVLGPVAARLDQSLNTDLAQARRALAAGMRGRRYLALLKELQAWSAQPPLVGPHARSAARVAKYLDRAEKRLDRRLALARRMPDDHPHQDDAMHRARKMAKRVRYLAELAEPILGKPARRSVKSAKRLQSDLGDRQDALLAVAFLRRVGAVAGTTPGENGFTFGILLANETHRGHLA